MLPERIKQVEYLKPGEPEQLSLGEGPMLTPSAGEVLIRVRAAGVNRPDVLQRQGLYPPPEDANPRLGLEVSGEVVALGEGAERWEVGDAVCALVNGGGYAEYALAGASHCLPVPEGLALADAAALPETTFTVWHNLWQRGRLQRGETLLVHGGASGIGTTAIQMAKALGVRVLVTAGGEQKCRACEALGADAAFDYQTQDFVKEVKCLTDGQGADVILDMVGGDYIQRNFSAAAREGRIVNIAFLKGGEATVNFLPLMLKRLTLTGSTLRAQSDAVKVQVARELEQTIWPLIASGAIRPLISERCALADVAQAHRLMESNRLIGKILLLPESDSKANS